MKCKLAFRSHRCVINGALWSLESQTKCKAVISARRSTWLGPRCACVTSVSTNFPESLALKLRVVERVSNQTRSHLMIVSDVRRCIKGRTGYSNHVFAQAWLVAVHPGRDASLIGSGVPTGLLRDGVTGASQMPEGGWPRLPLGGWRWVGRAHPPPGYLPVTQKTITCRLIFTSRLDLFQTRRDPLMKCHSATQRTMNTNLHCTHTSLPQHFFLLSHRPLLAPPAEAGEELRGTLNAHESSGTALDRRMILRGCAILWWSEEVYFHFLARSPCWSLVKFPSLFQHACSANNEDGLSRPSSLCANEWALSCLVMPESGFTAGINKVWQGQHSRFGSNWFFVLLMVSLKVDRVTLSNSWVLQCSR